jgi:hypothetical protein
VSKLIVQDRNGIRQVYISRLMTIGRSQNNDLVLRANLASRRHAWVWKQGDQVIIEDLGSTYGTLVNGQPITAPRFLNYNDVIYIGEARMILVAERDPSMEQTPPKGVPQIAAGQVLCSYCGSPNSPGIRYCGQCGQPLDLPVMDNANSRWRQDWEQTAPSRPITPLEPVIARPFPTVQTPPWQKSDSRIWVLILLLAILAVILVTIVGGLLVYVLA